MIAIDADHVAEAGLHAGLEAGLVRGAGGIGAGSPRAPETARAPKTVFRPEEDSQLVASCGEGRGVRVVGAADEVESGVLHQFHVAEETAVGHRVAPSRVVLVNVGAFEVIMFPVEEEALVGGEFEPAETQRRKEIVHCLAAVQNHGFYRIKIRVRGDHSLGSAIGSLVWSKILVSPGATVCVDSICPTVFPLASSTMVLTVADFARPAPTSGYPPGAPESFATSVFTFTVADCFETCGVVTNVPYQATCSGAVTTNRTSR